MQRDWQEHRRGPGFAARPPHTTIAIVSLGRAAGVSLYADTQLDEGFAVLVPLAPLVKNATYTARFSATLKSGGTPPLAKTWSFTTNP